MSDGPNSPAPPFTHSLEFINCTPSSPIHNGDTFIVKQEVDEESFIPNQEEDMKFAPDPLSIEPCISDTGGTVIKSELEIKLEDCCEPVIHDVQIHHGIQKNRRKIYYCPECKLRRTRKKDVLKHVAQRHRFDLNKPCRFCGELFPSLSHFQGHLKKSHRDVFICNLCIFYTKIKSYFCDHLRFHDLTFYKCKICHKPIHNLRELKSHKSKFHMKQKGPLNCAHCKYSTTQKSLLKVHIISRHFPKLIHRCSLCTNGYISRSEFKKHQKDHEKGITNRNKSSAEQIYCCKFCSYISIKNSTVKKHMGMCDKRNSSAFNTYRCEKCTEVFVNARDLRTHTRQKHVQIIYFGCEHCTYVARSRHSMEAHYKYNHMAGRPEFKCSSCPYVTSVREVCIRHEQRHGREPKPRRRYECSRCEFFSYHPARFVLHLRKFEH